jgi:hypothetical protein
VIDMRLLAPALKMRDRWRRQDSCDLDYEYDGSQPRGCVIAYRADSSFGFATDTHSFADEASGEIEARR